MNRRSTKIGLAIDLLATPAIYDLINCFATKVKKKIKEKNKQNKCKSESRIPRVTYLIYIIYLLRSKWPVRTWNLNFGPPRGSQTADKWLYLLKYFGCQIPTYLSLIMEFMNFFHNYKLSDFQTPTGTKIT